jgi:general secretion pathway protein B
VSFILEALKRSENERQRQTGPGIAASPEGSGEQRRSPWLVVIGVLLLVNLGVLGFLITRPDGTPAPAATVKPPAPARATTADDRRQRTQPAPAEAMRDQRPAEPAPATRPAETRVPRPAEAVTEPAPAAMPAPRGEVRNLSAEAADKPEAEAAPSAAGAPRVAAVTRPQRAPPAKASVGENLPTVQELTLRGEFSGRPLNLELHVYYDDPSRRLVFINGSKYREGERIDDDLRVDEIVPEGVVLHDGRQRFLLPST